jgi:hypothetical protein
MTISYILVASLGFFMVIYGSEVSVDLIVVELLFNLLMICHISGIFFRYVVVTCAVIFVIWVVIVVLYISDSFVVFGMAVVIMFFIVINTISVYSREIAQRSVSNLKIIA